ncbi:lipase family protein [Paenibacillus lemnae]|uniref:DUF2974 domain-containing protein n=1 Tax=Paenibacillus lemnae TaxID=1330551 RepID=A0A848M463_PAELE|nr:DUF2974 domain-containing protein [Paenibacillus lemnae]NMO95575.1 DUF2974 domain-containing protein [Paenibacillus lemnae]
MSSIAYDDLREGQQIEDLPGWVVLEDTNSRAISGMDVVTFVNPETNQAVIAYRGTEASEALPTSVPDFLADGGIGLGELSRKLEFERPFDEQLTAFEDTVGITALNNWIGDASKQVDKFVTNSSTNQLYQAENYANEMMEKYDNLDFSLTGHSLGGANAQYAAAYTGLDAVTFSAPSVVGSLTPEARRRAEEGAFDSQIINYAHPGDIIASGTLGGYDGHVGSTYYIDSSYADANDGISIKDKIDNTLGGPNYHQLDRYEFDENGYISNPLFDPVTGEELDSPRIPPNLFGLSGAAGTGGILGGGGVFGQLGAGSAALGAGAGTIQVTPAELRSVAERWRSNAHQCHNEIEGIRQRLNRYMHSSHSRRLTPIIQQVDQSVVSMSQWHMQHTGDIVDYIKYKADVFEQTDRSG